MMPKAPLAPILPPKSLGQARAATSKAQRAVVAQRVMSAAPEGLQAALVQQHISLPQAIKLRQALLAGPEPLSFSQIISLLPPKLAARIMQSRNEALLKMLLAWGKSLRKEAALARKAQLRRNEKAQSLKSQAEASAATKEQAQRAVRATMGARARALHLQLAANVLDAPATGSSLAARMAQSGLLATGLNRPVMEALHAPMASGFSLRGATLRLSTVS